MMQVLASFLFFAVLFLLFVALLLYITTAFYDYIKPGRKPKDGDKPPPPSSPSQ